MKLGVAPGYDTVLPLLLLLKTRKSTMHHLNMRPPGATPGPMPMISLEGVLIAVGATVVLFGFLLLCILKDCCGIFGSNRTQRRQPPFNESSSRERALLAQSPQRTFGSLNDSSGSRSGSSNTEEMAVIDNNAPQQDSPLSIAVTASPHGSP